MPIVFHIWEVSSNLHMKITGGDWKRNKALMALPVLGVAMWRQQLNKNLGRECWLASKNTPPLFVCITMAYKEPGTVLDTKERQGNRANNNPCPLGAYFIEGARKEANKLAKCKICQMVVIAVKENKLEKRGRKSQEAECAVLNSQEKPSLKSWPLTEISG